MSGARLELGLGARLVRDEFFPAAARCLPAFFAPGGCKLASFFLAGAACFLNFGALTAAFLAVAAFLRAGAATRLVLDLDLVVLARATFLALADATFLVGDFLGLGATLFLDNRCLVDCLLKAERFVTLLVGL